MAYSNNPNLIKARRDTLLAVISHGMPICTAARHFGVHRATVWRWIKRWKAINCNVKDRNYNRPSRTHAFKEENYCWMLPILSSAPKTHPMRIPEWVVRRVVELRTILKRCAVIIRQKLLEEGVRISVSTIERIIAKFCTLKTKHRKIRRTLPRPDVKAPGDLVEMDTVHYVNKITGERRYVFTVIDLFSRVSYARCFNRLLPGNALMTLLEAEQYFGFKIRVIQTDNGPEFSRWFTSRTEAELQNGERRIHRHTRIHRPNDNAHIERFNRTLREECIGDHMSCHHTVVSINQKLRDYLDYYNEKRLHLGIQCRTPRQMLQR